MNETRLNISNNQLSSIPESLKNQKSLKFLDLSNNNITSLPEWFSSLSNLESLNISSNRLTSIPESISSLINLKYLHIDYNELTSIPGWFSSLINLENLNISNNQLTSIPESFGNLNNLTYLIICHNQLVYLPDSFGNLTNLKSLLDISYNKLQSLPESFKNIKNCEYLVIHHNPIRSLSNIGLNFLSYLIHDRWDLDENELLEYVNINYIEKLKSCYYDVCEEILKELVEYYKRSPQTLALQHADDQNSLTDEEKERLAYEGGWKEREILELKVPPNNPILAEITKRLTIEFPNGFKILK